MHLVMVKKELADGSPCRKCGQAEEMLKRRGLWDKVDRVVVAKEGDDSSEGVALAQKHGVETAPFFILEQAGTTEVITSAIVLTRALKKRSASASHDMDLGATKAKLTDAVPEAIVAEALTQYGDRCAIAFSGAEDIVVVHMAVKSGHPFRVFCLDTGRLHAETLAYIEEVRTHYGIAIDVLSPEQTALEAFVRERGLFSFYEEGHKACCDVRKVASLRRYLAHTLAWITGQRRDQSTTRSALLAVEEDGAFEGAEPAPLIKFNPLAHWNRDDVWSYIRSENIPTNPLHDQGYKSIGCAPCTRPTTEHQHEREGRWWWEDEGQKECGLHLGKAESG